MKRKLLIGVYHPSIILTYIGVFLSLLGIIIALSKIDMSFGTHVKIACILLILAGICDMFDGTVARMFKNRSDTAKAFGVQLDSLADTVSFVVFPACLLITCGDLSITTITVSIIYIFAGIMRLGWFNVLAEMDEGNSDCFYGVPVTTVSLLFPIAVTLLSITNASQIAIHWSLSAVMTVLSVAFVSNVRIKKPSNIIKCILLTLIIAAIVLLLVYVK